MNVTVNKITRQNVLNAIDGLTWDQLNYIPEGRSNSIFWNVAHMLVTQQLLTLGLLGEEMLVPSEMIAKYRKGASGNVSGTKEEWQFIRDAFVEIISRTQDCIKKMPSKGYKTYTTSYGVTLKEVEDAMAFNNVHDGVHLGIILAIKKQIV